MKGAYKGLRGFIDLLEQEGQLARVSSSVAADQELAAVFTHAAKSRNRALFFENVSGSDLPILIGTMASRERLLLALGAAPADLDEVAQEVLRPDGQDLAPEFVSSAPSQSCWAQGADVDLGVLPVPKFAEKEGGPYITAGVAVSEDPETGARNAGIYRLMVRGRDQLNVNFGFPNRHMLVHARKSHARGQPLPVAIAIGCDPALWLCAAMPLPARVDEVERAGSLMGRPVALARGRTIDIGVPADAEIVLECEFDLTQQEPEGPYNDFQGYYTAVRDNYVLNVRAISHRLDPIFETSMTGHVPEGEMEVYRWLLVRQQKRQVQAVVPQVRAMTFDPASRGHVYIVSVAKKRPLLASQVGSAVLSFPWSSVVKAVIVVDDDIDVDDPAQVMWALSTRVDFERDLNVVPSLPGASFDVATGGRQRVSKVIIDATMTLEAEGYPGSFPEPGIPSAEVLRRVKEMWPTYKLG